MSRENRPKRLNDGGGEPHPPVVVNLDSPCFLWVFVVNRP